MTAPEGTTPSPPPANPRLLNRLDAKPLTARRAALTIASITASITIISGVAMHFTDEKTYPNIGDGLWWAIQTVTTVGYGDLVPASTVGRLLAALVMVVGIGFLTVITAAITSAFIESARRRLQRNHVQASALADNFERRVGRDAQQPGGEARLPAKARQILQRA